MKSTVDKIWSMMQANQATGHQKGPGTEVNDFISNDRLHFNRDRLEDLEFPHISEAQNDGDKTAPIIIVRKFRSAKRRLYKYSGRDIVESKIVPEDVADKLVFEYVLLAA